MDQLSQQVTFSASSLQTKLKSPPSSDDDGWGGGARLLSSELRFDLHAVCTLIVGASALITAALVLALRRLIFAHKKVRVSTIVVVRL